MLNWIAGIPPIWQALSSLALVGVLMGSCMLRDASLEKRGVAKERARIERAGEANAKKADAARRSVDGVPVERLKDKYLRD